MVKAAQAVEAGGYGKLCGSGATSDLIPEGTSFAGMSASRNGQSRYVARAIENIVLSPGEGQA